jgi:hypothetical protein
MYFEKKLLIKNPISWDHHRHGWKEVIDCIKTNFECINGVWFYSHIETEVKEEITIEKPWVGFMHNTPQHPIHIKNYYGDTVYIDNFLKSKLWIDSSNKCQGIFVLSNYCKKYFLEKTSVPINNLIHPTSIPDIKFDLQKFALNKYKKLIMTGHWLRNFQSFDNLKSIYPKFWLECGDFNYANLSFNSVTKLKRVSNEEYDKILSENLIFLDFYDTSANNALLECISRNTPVCVRKLPAVEEYLGNDYPLYFETLSEAEQKLCNIQIIIKSYEYLKNINKTKFSYDYFAKEFAKSQIYQSLKPKRKIKFF